MFSDFGENLVEDLPVCRAAPLATAFDWVVGSFFAYLIPYI